MGTPRPIVVDSSEDVQVIPPVETSTVGIVDLPVVAVSVPHPTLVDGQPT